MQPVQSATVFPRYITLRQVASYLPIPLTQPLSPTDTKFSKVDIENASCLALHHLNGHTCARRKRGRYPHEFRNTENFTFDNSSCTSPYYEFPVFNHKTNTEGWPGRDRVVIGSHDPDASTAVYCGWLPFSLLFFFPALGFALFWDRV